jgi:hypothetical protein
MELLAFLILVYAVKKAIDDTRGALRKSRAAAAQSPGGGQLARLFKHDFGFLANQLANGFPTARHGFMRGWHQASQAHTEAMAGRQKAKTEQLEHHAGLVPQLADYRTRQQAALERIQAPQTPDPATAPEAAAGQPPDGNAPDDLAERAWDGRGIGPEDVEPQPAPQPQAAPRDHVAGWDDPLPGETRVVTENGQPVHNDPAPANPAPAPDPQPSTAAATEGTNDMAGSTGDTTYNQQRDELIKIREDAEEEVNSVRRKRMMNRLDILTSLGLDSASLSEAAAIDDALREQEKAAQQTLDAADAAVNGLQKRHGGIQEAVDNSPIEQPAQPEFYTN